MAQIPEVCKISKIPTYFQKKLSFFPSPGDFFKICLNIVENVPKTRKNCKRRNKKYLDSSVKKLFVLAIVKSVPETHENTKAIMKALNLENVKLDFCLTADMKLQNIIMGLQGGSSTYPCVYCESARPFTKSGKLRTLGRIRKLSKSFKRSKKKNKLGKDFFNCIHEPLFSGEDDDSILDLLPIPELHILIGIGNYNC